IPLYHMSYKIYISLHVLNDHQTLKPYTLSLHDALQILIRCRISVFTMPIHWGSIPDHPGSNGISFKSIKNQIQKTGYKYPISSFYICYICYRPIYQRQNGVSTKPHNQQSRSLLGMRA